MIDIDGIDAFEADPEDDADACGEVLSVAAGADDAGVRIDLFAAARFESISRAEAQRLLAPSGSDTAGMHVNGLRVKPNYRLRAGDVVTLQRATHSLHTGRAEPEAIPLDVVYEDADLLVINKARGMVVHPAPGSPSGTLVNAVLAHTGSLSGIGGEIRPGVVHRLDKDTGGLLVVAKNDAAHRSLQAQIQSRTAERKYLAIVWGVPAFTDATVEAAIGRHPIDRKKMAVITDASLTSRPALTELRVKAAPFGLFALIEAKLQTGRTHQIRVHCAYINHPIVGDAVYGGVRKLPAGGMDARQRGSIEAAIAGLGGQALHAVSLSFFHPTTGNRLAFSVPPADEMQVLMQVLGVGF